MLQVWSLTCSVLFAARAAASATAPLSPRVTPSNDKVTSCRYWLCCGWPGGPGNAAACPPAAPSAKNVSGLFRLGLELLLSYPTTGLGLLLDLQLVLLLSVADAVLLLLLGCDGGRGGHVSNDVSTAQQRQVSSWFCERSRCVTAAAVGMLSRRSARSATAWSVSRFPAAHTGCKQLGATKLVKRAQFFCDRNRKGAALARVHWQPLSAHHHHNLQGAQLQQGALLNTAVKCPPHIRTPHTLT